MRKITVKVKRWKEDTTYTNRITGEEMIHIKNKKHLKATWNLPEIDTEYYTDSEGSGIFYIDYFGNQRQIKGTSQFCILGNSNATIKKIFEERYPNTKIEVINIK